MKKINAPTSKYVLQTRADAESAYKNKYTRNKIKSNKEMWALAALSGLGVMYLVEIVLLAGKLAISKITSVGGGVVHNIASNIPGATTDAAAKAEAAARQPINAIDVLKFLVGFSEVWIGVLMMDVRLINYLMLVN